MEEKAIEIIQLMLDRRQPGVAREVKEVTIENVTQGGTNPANAYLIGDILVVFSRKAKLLENEMEKMMNSIEGSEYSKTRLIVVSLSKPSVNVLKGIKYYAKEGVQFFQIQELQYDLMAHRMYMPHRIVNEDERSAIFNAHKVSDPENQLPWIDSQDPPIKWIGAKPGDVIEVTRHSDAAGPTKYYRYVVEDVNITQ